MDENTPGISEPAAQAARDLRVLVSRLRRRLRELYDTQDLTPSQVSVLSRLGQDGAASASDLAAAERVRPQSMASILAVLRERGLIQRHPDPKDGRRQLISLSESGLATMYGSREARDEWLARALQDRYTEEQRKTIIEALSLLERLTQ
ncbi:MarR family winged helix-turn-helix transcriptional regulator [Streptomyces sp. NBC_00996]|uniref:MarR family winged helix-turn-helix transcriptional regulator n=1 Tax=Streptomyces sp. NBC_00996 TaxID=2903710 RepID=UPI00386D30F1|nr:MarR family transcriptional regulator [Streptomyces sp. NBC_00996]